jgi:hypothetical protein
MNHIDPMGPFFGTDFFQHLDSNCNQINERIMLTLWGPVLAQTVFSAWIQIAIKSMNGIVDPMGPCFGTDYFHHLDSNSNQIN